MFTVDGVSYNVLVVQGSLHRSFEIKEGPGSILYMDGDEDPDIIGTYYNYELEIDTRNSVPEEYDALYEVLSAPVKSHMVSFPYGQSILTFEARVTAGGDNFRRKLAGKQFWSGLSITFRAKKPQREPT